MPAGRNRRRTNRGGKIAPSEAQRRRRALLVASAVMIFACGLLVPVVAFSRSGGSGTPRKGLICYTVGNITVDVGPGCDPTTTATMPTTTTEPTTTEPTTTEPTTTEPTTPTTPVSHEPAPVVGQSAVVATVRGIVRVRVPGSRRFVTLSGRHLIPVGSAVDTRDGTIGITSARLHGTQTGTFHSGMFRLRQPVSAATRAGRKRIITVLHLMGGSFKGCEADEDNTQAVTSRTAVAARRRPRHRVVRRLWGSEGGGGWGTAGGQAAGTVSGTVWLTEDTCLGTYIFVKRGSVMVHNLVTGRTVRVRAGHHYLARAPDPT